MFIWPTIVNVKLLVSSSYAVVLIMEYTELVLLHHRRLTIKL